MHCKQEAGLPHGRQCRRLSTHMAMVSGCSLLQAGGCGGQMSCRSRRKTAPLAAWLPQRRTLPVHSMHMQLGSLQPCMKQLATDPNRRLTFQSAGCRRTRRRPVQHRTRRISCPAVAGATTRLHRRAARAAAQPAAHPSGWRNSRRRSASRRLRPAAASRAGR